MFNNKKLEGILQQHNIKLIYGVHHALYNQSHLNWKISSRNIEIADVQNISKYIRTTDLFITDYSSIVFDFMFLDIPVIFYKLDFKDIHLHNVDKMSINNFNSCQKYIYNCTEDEDELIIKIKEYVDNGFKLEDDKRIQNDKFFYFKDNIAERLCAKLEKL